VEEFSYILTPITLSVRCETNIDMTNGMAETVPDVIRPHPSSLRCLELAQLNPSIVDCFLAPSVWQWHPADVNPPESRQKSIKKVGGRSVLPTERSLVERTTEKLYSDVRHTGPPAGRTENVSEAREH